MWRKYLKLFVLCHMTSELAQKSNVVFDKQPDIVDAVLAHSDSLDAKSEGPAGINLRVNADRFEDIRMHHPTAAKFDPALLILKPDIALGRGLGEGKETGAEANLGFRAE